PRDADDEADNGREHDPDHRYEQRVQQADQEGAAIAGLQRIGDEGDGDVEAGDAVEEAEARGDAALVKIDSGVVNGERREREGPGGDEDLQDHGAGELVLPQGTAAHGVAGFAHDGHGGPNLSFNAWFDNA